MGLGYYLTQSDVAVFVELSYVLWSKTEVDYNWVPRFGLELRF
jgi:hypothetical protein